METVGVLDAWRQPVSTPRILKKLSYSEHACRTCGHTFGFRSPAAPSRGPQRQEWIS